MKKKYLKVQVANPCHENWEKMTPSQKGRFCKACAKEVIDFTKLSDRQIVAFYHQNKGKAFCGHFKGSQLDRSIPFTKPTNNYLIMRAVGIAIAGLIGVGSINGQTHQAYSTKTEKQVLTTNNKKETQQLFQGKIIWQSSGEPVIYGTINIWENGAILASGLTDFDGNFSIGLPRHLFGEKIEVEFSQVGAQTQKKWIELGPPVLVGVDHAQTQEIVLTTGMVGFKHTDIPVQEQNAKNDPTYLSGIVYDQNDNNRLQGASVVIYYGDRMIGGTSTDPTGFYYYRLDDEISTDQIEVRISYIGYQDLFFTPSSEKIMVHGLNFGVELPTAVVSAIGNDRWEAFYSGGGSFSVVHDYELPSPDEEVNEVLELIYKVFPNPFFDYLDIQIETAQNEHILIQLIDIKGSIIFEERKRLEPGLNQFKLDLIHSNLSAGSYIIAISNKDELLHSEVIIRHQGKASPQFPSIGQQ